MKKNPLILLLSIGLIAGSMFSSCRKETVPGEKTEPGTEDGTASLALNIKVDGILPTRAEESTGMEHESWITSLRIILYNTEGIAEYVDDYSIKIGFQSGEWEITVPNNKINQSTLIYNGQGNPLMAVFLDIKKQDYQVLVIANPFGSDGSSNLSNVFDTDGNQASGLTSEKGHSVSLFNTPWDLTTALNGYGGLSQEFIPSYTIYYWGLSLATLIGNSNFGWSYLQNGYRIEDLAQKDYYSGMYQLSLLMLNADGLVEITSGNLFPSLEKATDNAVAVYVERAVAKTALFDQLPNTLAHGATIGNGGTVNWTTDILNYHGYLLRQKAPLSNGSPELASSLRKYRYALDPNYTGVSIERPGNSSSAAILERNIYNVKGMLGNNEPDITENDLFYRESNGNTYDSDGHDWTYWDYLVENTMEAGEQYEDVTPRILVRLNYVPGTSQIMPSPGGGQPSIGNGTSYYSYKNALIFSVADMNTIAGDIDAQIELVKGQVADDDTKNLLDELKTVLTDGDTRTAFGSFSGTPTKGVSYNGLNFHLNGTNYYYVLLRHFDNATQPTPMAYGRYGVVRNNVYKVVLTNINGPGAGVIPDPKGPDDKTDVVRSRIQVTDWAGKPLNYTFGQ